MHVTTTAKDGYTLAKTEGPLDETAREIFREQLHPLVGSPGAKLVMDLSGTLRVNSPGLSHLITLVVHSNTNASRVVICCVPPFVSMVFSVSKLNTFFEMADTIEQAEARISQPQSA
jgi:anti-anti-sigma factor